VICVSSEGRFAFSDKIVSNGSLAFEAAKMLQTKGEDEDSVAADAVAVVNESVVNFTNILREDFMLVDP